MTEPYPWCYCPSCGFELEKDTSDIQTACFNCGFAEHQSPVIGVRAIPVDSNGRLLLLQRFCNPGMGLWDTLGGLIHSGEGASDGLVRILRKETF